MDILDEHCAKLIKHLIAASEISQPVDIQVSRLRKRYLKCPFVLVAGFIQSLRYGFYQSFTLRFLNANTGASFRSGESLSFVRAGFRKIARSMQPSHSNVRLASV